MKAPFIIIILSFLTLCVNAQTMKWIPVNPAKSTGACGADVIKKQKLLCYGLEYTPAVTGTLTSYTTAFFVSCTSQGSPVSTNQSCSMNNNVNVINGCQNDKMILMNSSGNSGTLVNNQVSSGVPVILHQVCFSIPKGESITIKEDQITDLTTSIDITGGESKTEFPAFEEAIIRREIAYVSRPLFLDFKGIPVADFTSQLDWVTSDENNSSHFVIERSKDGTEFSAVGTINAVSNPGRINVYQFLDKGASLGNNYYRIKQVGSDDKTEYSPVRLITFSEMPFTVKVSPNPANQFILVDIQSPVSESTIKLLDPSGRVVIDEKNDNKLIKTRLNIEKLSAGRYTLIVETEKDKYTETVIVVH